jgi:hypothetical protein
MFAAWVFGLLFVAFLVLIAIGLWHRRSASDIWDKDRLKRWETQANIEERDIGEMIHAANERRRLRGEPPLTKEEIDARVAEEQKRSLEQADKAIKGRDS